MPTRTDRDQTWDRNGKLVQDEQVERDITVEENESTLRTRAESALADLRILAGTSGTLTTAQLSNAVRLLARVALAVARLHLRRFDSAD